MARSVAAINHNGIRTSDFVKICIIEI